MDANKNKSFLSIIVDAGGAALGISLMWAVIVFVTLIGYKNTLALGRLLGATLFRFSGQTRAKVLHNLTLAYDDTLTAEQKLTIARASLQLFCTTWIELFYLAGPRKKQVHDTVTISGREHLDRALAKGRGVIAVSAHLGNYPLIGIKLCKEGYNFITVIRDLKTMAGSATYGQARKCIELPFLATTPERQFFKNALKILKNNGILCLIADENKRTGGVFVDFFGRPASTAPGAAGLALRTGAAVVPVYIIRTSPGAQQIIIEKEIEFEPTGDEIHDTTQITALFTTSIEQQIRKDPAQWAWTSWRWRTQPEGQSSEAKIPKKKRLKKFKKWLKNRGKR